ncbi:hypothetical protein C8J57DRAFT_1255280 [Mycena rebaudengoi]|nr:hypothetical protein C8J57DRAFT_1255280 [Mycena rebaudengoi]
MNKWAYRHSPFTGGGGGGGEAGVGNHSRDPWEQSQGMATGVDKGVDMGICVPGNNGVNTVVVAWSTPTQTVSTRGYLGRPRACSGIFQLWHVWLSDAAQAGRGTGGAPFQTFLDTLSWYDSLRGYHN